MSIPTELTIRLESEISEGMGKLSKRELGNLKERLADSLYSSGQFDASINSLKEAVTIYEIYNDSKALARLSNKIACTCFAQNSYAEALEYFNEQHRHGQESKKVVTASRGLTNKSIVELLTGNYDDAVKSIDSAIQILNEGSDDEVSTFALVRRRSPPFLPLSMT